jgi:Zn-dependent protease
VDENLKQGIYLFVALLAALYVREYVRALVADRLGDPSARQFGWLRLDPRGRADPFGTYLLPILIAVLWASGAGYRPPPFAYAKPMPFQPSRLRDARRDEVVVALAGPATNLLIGVVAGLALRAFPLSEATEATAVLSVLTYVNIVMCVFHLMPIPGLDGARLLARVLPLRAQIVYRNLDQYLALFTIVIFFVFAGPMLTIVNVLTNAVCRLVAGFPCLGP